MAELSIEAKWAEFKSKHGKSYGSEEEEANRFKIFQENVKTIEEHNKKYEAGETTFTMAINKFADLRSEEVVKGYTGLKRPDKQN